jgi:alanyl-tRNA synthetase
MKRGSLNVGTVVTAKIDAVRRQKIANNHTATHLLHWALHSVLGEHIKQAGSIVEPGRLRFDFSHHKALAQDEITLIENLVNQRIRENHSVQTYELSYEEAQKNTGIKQFFGEKYGSKVRVVDIDFSKELCGGTHTQELGRIGLFKIAKESSIAAGVRRIEAVTGEEAEILCHQNEKQLLDLAAILKTQVPLLSERLGKLLEENKQLSQQLKVMKKQVLGSVVESLATQVEHLEGIPFLAVQVDGQNEELRVYADELTLKLPSSVIILGAQSNDDNCQLLVRVSDDLVGKGIKANEIIKKIAPLVEGSGGGKANSAQAGGKKPQGIQAALAKAKELIVQ